MPPRRQLRRGLSKKEESVKPALKQDRKEKEPTKTKSKKTTPQPHITHSLSDTNSASTLAPGKIRSTSTGTKNIRHLSDMGAPSASAISTSVSSLARNRDRDSTMSNQASTTSTVQGFNTAAHSRTSSISGKMSPVQRIIDPNEKLYPVVTDPKRPNVYSYLTLRELTDHVIDKTTKPKVKREKGTGIGRGKQLYTAGGIVGRKGLRSVAEIRYDADEELENSTLSTALQLALDCNVPSSKLRYAACANLIDGRIIAKTSTFGISSDDILRLRVALEDSISTFENGIVVAGVKYDAFRADDLVLYAKNDCTGVIAQRTCDYVAIGIYDETISPVNAVNGVSELVSLLEREERLAQTHPWLKVMD